MRLKGTKQTRQAVELICEELDITEKDIATYVLEKEAKSKKLQLGKLKDIQKLSKATEKERVELKLKAEKELEDKINSRIKSLVDNGMSYDVNSDSCILDEIKINRRSIKKQTDEDFERLVVRIRTLSGVSDKDIKEAEKKEKEDLAEQEQVEKEEAEKVQLEKEKAEKEKADQEAKITEQEKIIKEANEKAEESEKKRKEEIEIMNKKLADSEKARIVAENKADKKSSKKKEDNPVEDNKEDKDVQSASNK